MGGLPEYARASPTIHTRRSVSVLVGQSMPPIVGFAQVRWGLAGLGMRPLRVSGRRRGFDLEPAPATGPEGSQGVPLNCACGACACCGWPQVGVRLSFHRRSAQNARHCWGPLSMRLPHAPRSTSHAIFCQPSLSHNEWRGARHTNPMAPPAMCPKPFLALEKCPCHRRCS